MKKSKFLLMLLTLMLTSMTSLAQKRTLTGSVVDNTGEAVIGASVVQKGTSNGVITDYDGNFRIDVEPGTMLTVSYMGYKSQDVRAIFPSVNVTLSPDEQLLDEVVVIGYGVQKKSVVTASIAKVSADDLAGTAPVRVDNALKGLASGVTVTAASGQPGAAARVSIRGIGTINNADPLYIVDGMPLEGNIDYLNPSDIESIEVLKDAASGAVYGARAANGVVIVTTKSGKLGKTAVNYNFSYGIQNPWRKREVLNATEYALLINEGLMNSGAAPRYADPYSFGEGTNWQEEVFNDDAPVVNHEVNVSGATEKVNYYLSLGYYDQEGIVGGNYDRSNYKRLTLRSNTKYVLFDATKERQWLNKLTVTSNLSYARVKSVGIGTNSEWGSVLGSALCLSPIVKPYLTGAEATAALADYQNLYGASGYQPMYNADGALYTVPGSEFKELNNPLAMMALPGAYNWVHKFVANFAADLSLGYGFNYRISYGADLNFNGIDKGYNVLYYLSGNNNATKNGANAQSNRSTNWQLENVLTWDKTFDRHTVNVVLGQSAKKSTGWYLGGSRNNLVDPTGAKPYIDYATGLAVDGDMNVWGGPNETATLASLFARASYNYDERYMLQATVRRDGSSRFGSNNHYATFPSFSVGWNIMNEKFMEQTRDWLTNLKLRASWGKNGNENIGNFRYAVYTESGHNVLFGRNENEIRGVKAGGLANPDLKWEESEQTDLGIDFGFFNNALTFSADYYIKKTNGMLMEIPINNYVGESKPIGNVGDMKNSGFEFELGYKFNVADAKFQIKGNLSYLKNELVKLGNESGYMGTDSYANVGTIARAMNGEPFPYFYGYKTDGIFQNMAEVMAYTNDQGGLIQPNAVPGDVRFVDVNGDGKISDLDETKIGKGMPDWTFGLSLNAEWRGFDFSAFLQGTIGNDIYDATFGRSDAFGFNMPRWMLGRWTGEGTSNTTPRYVAGDAVNWMSSDLYVYDGSYMRLKNIQLGYTLPRELTRKAFIERLRVYVAAENLLTFTKYHGFDTEIAADQKSLGIDKGVYPQARVFTVGLNLGF